MLTLLTIKNVALIDEVSVEFGPGLNLLTGETGSGKSIIVDSLAALTGERASSDLIKQGAAGATIEGCFVVEENEVLNEILEESGIETGDELIVRREISIAGKNRVYVNNILVTQALLKRIGAHLADIHGQGEQASLYDVGSHIAILDSFASVEKERGLAANAFGEWSRINSELSALRKDESEKLQLLDILRFQANEIRTANLSAGEDIELEKEKRRLANAEKLSALSDEIYTLLYEADVSTSSTLERVSRKIDELGEFEPGFRDFQDGLAAARAVVDEAAMLARDLRSKLEFSPERLNEIETRLAEITRLTRKYGGSVEAVLEHLEDTERRLENIETAELREKELRKELTAAESAYEKAAAALSAGRVAAAVKFSKAVEAEAKLVALDKASFEVKVEPSDTFSANGSDRVEFFFSANPGEAARPLARVASGGEASRLMLILKTVSRTKDAGKTAVFDEIDIGIGGRVAEAVGRKLKSLASETQVFCITHQAQIASLADHHFVVEKDIAGPGTRVTVRELTRDEKIDEIARMLAGENVTKAARENAKAMLAAAK